MKKTSQSDDHENAFPKKDGKLDFTTFWQLKKNERTEATNWLLKHGTEAEKEDLNNIMQSVNENLEYQQKRRARLTENDENQNHSKHPRKKNRRGGCSIQ